MMKTYVITLSKAFPKGHKKQGESTGFEDKVLNALNNSNPEQPKKLHTIRANFGLWALRIAEIKAGRAVLSIRQWTGKPYRSKQREIARMSKESGIGIQAVLFPDLTNTPPIIIGALDKTGLSEVAHNDGLSFEDWQEWFKTYDLSKSLAIIHFTKFRYK